MSVQTPESPSAVPEPCDVQATFCASLVDEWLRAGITEAVISPGSRSTPLVLALAGRPEMRTHVRLDERSAGFFAVGAARASGRPVVVCATSGTAAAELHASVIEADLAGVPLVVCTADRPPRLHKVGAAQTIDQSGIYAQAVRWSCEPGVPSWPDRTSWRSIASRSVAEASTGPGGPGPVHLNLAFDEPLIGRVLSLPPGRTDGSPWHAVLDGPRLLSSANPRAIDPTAAKRVLVIVGQGAGSPEKVLGMARTIRAPVLADPLSGCRFPRDGVVASADSILRDDSVAQGLRPEVVVRLGGAHASKVLAGRLHEWSECGTVQIQVDAHWRWVDPDRDAATIIVCDPGSWCDAVSEAARSSDLQAAATGVGAEDLDRVLMAREKWFEDWCAAESAAQRAIASWCGRHPETTEPGVARTLLGSVPPETTLVVSSSMPVRDLEWFAPAVERPPRTLANRGANGIDGVVSTAAGVAAVTDAPVVAIVGDLAFLHDLTALLEAPGARRALVVVVIDNGGGGIFSFLPQRGRLVEEAFERLFATPQSVDVSAVAAGMGLEVTEVSTTAALEAALTAALEVARPSVIRVRVPGGDRNVAEHEEIASEVRAMVVAELGRTRNLQACS